MSIHSCDKWEIMSRADKRGSSNDAMHMSEHAWMAGTLIDGLCAGQTLTTAAGCARFSTRGEAPSHLGQRRSAQRLHAFSSLQIRHVSQTRCQKKIDK